MIKKITTTLIMFALLSTTAFAAFPDVTESHENYDAINYVQSQGIVQGYKDGTYHPDSEISRVEFTKIIIESAFTEDIIGNCNIDGTTFFSDTLVGEWYAKYICVAKTYDVINGYPDGTFKPNHSINFVEAAKIIAISFQYPITATEPWYESYVEILMMENAIPTSIRELEQNITRGEMAEMVYRLLNNIKDKDSRIFWDYEGMPDPTEEVDGEVFRQAFIKQNPDVDFSESIITVYEINDSYAFGGIGEPEGGGAAFYSAEVGGEWIIVATVQDTVFCSTIAPYDFPASMIPECWDDVAQEVVTR